MASELSGPRCGAVEAPWACRTAGLPGTSATRIGARQRCAASGRGGVSDRRAADGNSSVACSSCWSSSNRTPTTAARYPGLLGGTPTGGTGRTYPLWAPGPADGVSQAETRDACPGALPGAKALREPAPVELLHRPVPAAPMVEVEALMSALVRWILDRTVGEAAPVRQADALRCRLVNPLNPYSVGADRSFCCPKPLSDHPGLGDLQHRLLRPRVASPARAEAVLDQRDPDQ